MLSEDQKQSLNKQHFFTFEQGYFKVMVAAGMQTGAVATDSIEIIDLESSATNCSSIPVFPFIVYAPFGGLSFQNVPFICGGTSSSYLYENRCYTLVNGAWNQTYTLRPCVPI